MSTTSDLLRRGGAWLTAVTIGLAVPALVGGSSVSAAGTLRTPCASKPTAVTGPGLTNSAVTINGCADGLFGEDFSKLQITVSQTRNLTNQGITVSWKGGTPTLQKPDNIEPAMGNYLQMMQCWGNPDAANFRETCEYGGIEDSERAYSSTDPQEALLPDGVRQEPDSALIRFRRFGGSTTSDEDFTHTGSAKDPYKPLCDRSKGEICDPESPTSELSRFFTVDSANHRSKVLTDPSGNGQTTFEVQNNPAATQLGCGRPGHLTCYLVIVPRGLHDPNGAVPSEFEPSNPLSSSPLSASNFSNRIVVPLQFEQVGEFCPSGVQAKPTAGSELVRVAVESWQPALCKNNGPVFSYSGVGDFSASDQLLSSSPLAPGLAFTADPIVPPPGGAKVFHAPVALSSMVVAFNIDKEADPGQTAAGFEIPELNLTQRLVAKLLTQSYQADLPNGRKAKETEKNYRSIRDDPEFLAINPEFKQFRASVNFEGLIVSGGKNAANREVWRWILADKDAREWLQGKAETDANNNVLMKVNSHYLPKFATGQLPPQGYDRDDQETCETIPANKAHPEVPFCGLDLRPLRGSYLETAYRTLRANAGSGGPNTSLTDAKPTVTFPAQTVTNRFAAAITDAGAAARYGLRTARLRNSAGKFVAATPASVTAAAEAMVPSSVPGVSVIDPTKKVDTAYPLGMITYAAATTARPAADRQAFASMIKYAVTDGQKPGVDRGMLPPGYVPLPDELRNQATTAAAQLAAFVDPPKATSAPTGPDGPSAPVAGAPKPPLLSPADPAVAKPVAAPAASPLPSPSPSVGTKAVAQLTKGMPVGYVRWFVVALIVLGALAGVAGPALLLRARRRATPELVE